MERDRFHLVDVAVPSGVQRLAFQRREEARLALHLDAHARHDPPARLEQEQHLVQEPVEETLDALRLDGDLRLAHDPRVTHVHHVRDEAFGGGRERVRERGTPRADADVRRVLEVVVGQRLASTLSAISSWSRARLGIRGVNLRTIIAALLVALAIAAPAGAEECVPTTSNAYQADKYYVDFSCFADDPDTCDTICLALLVPYGVFCTLWIYEESNEIAGLQRGDEIVDETCHGMIAPDTIVS